MWKYFFLKENVKIRWWFSVLSSVYIVLFTFVLEPLKNESYHYNYPTYYNLIALIVFFAINSIFSIYLPFIYPSFFQSNKWSLKRFIIWFCLPFFTVILFSFFFDFYSYKFEYTIENVFSYFFHFQFLVDAFMLIPILFFFFSTYSKSNLKKTEETPISLLVKQIPKDYSDASIAEIVEPVKNSTILLFTDKNGKKELQITFEQLYYIASADNYVDIFYKNEEGKLISLTLRNTLKTIEEHYIHMEGFFRCHKAFIVNCQKVKAIKGNAKGYFLILEDVNDKIPVSRNKNEDLERLFPHLL